MCGITGGVTKAHLARAVLEGVALQNVDILTSMEKDSGAKLSQLKVDGGMARNNLMMQIQADVLGVSCVRPTVLETTALGAAFLAGLGVGFWSDTNAIKDDGAWTRFLLLSLPMKASRNCFRVGRVQLIGHRLLTANSLLALPRDGKMIELPDTAKLVQACENLPVFPCQAWCSSRTVIRLHVLRPAMSNS